MMNLGGGGGGGVQYGGEIKGGSKSALASSPHKSVVGGASWPLQLGLKTRE